jgi:hypothetical protein
MNILHWIQGFLFNKERLSEEETKVLKDKVDNELVKSQVSLPYINDSIMECKFPNDCGMPTVWFGVIPPICSKCGYQSQQWTITSTTDGIFSNNFETYEVKDGKRI